MKVVPGDRVAALGLDPVLRPVKWELFDPAAAGDVEPLSWDNFDNIDPGEPGTPP